MDDISYSTLVCFRSDANALTFASEDVASVRLVWQHLCVSWAIAAWQRIILGDNPSRH